MNETIFLTGATGFIGAQIARRLVDDTAHHVVVLVRGENLDAAVHKLTRAWWDWRALTDAIGERVEVVCGDVRSPQLGLAENTYTQLTRRLTHIIHTAADLRLDAPLNELRRTNVHGVANVLELARAAHRDHGLTRYAHLSTAYVCGARTGDINEYELADERGFSNGYEQTKFEGEQLAQAAHNEIPVSIFRPGMVIGDSRTGYIKTFNTFYFPLRLYLTGSIPVLPARPGLRVNIVPVDYVADAIVRLAFNPRAAGQTFHLTPPHEDLPTARELGEFVRQWAQEQLHLTLPRPFYLPLPIPAQWLRRALKPGANPARSTLSAILSLLPYYNQQRRFRRENTDRLLGSYAFKWRDLLPPILEYASYMGFMHHSDRTIHEQVLVRLESKNRPVTCHDIVAGEITTRPAAAVRQEILAAAGALGAMGIVPGDRVALVGFNSTRYLALEAAIGLAGGVSVPLYYTSPPSEMDRILKASGARVLFIGAPKLLERLGELETQLPIISFCRQATPATVARPVMAWEEFLALGAGSAPPAHAPVSLGDLATLRYTSGTTGNPKGVAFKHDQLKWLAETVASLPPWQARTRRVSYLSFLPMNHVVEGILATYSPYYAPAPLDLYFLEDLMSLPRALPRVKPTVFFGVPRIYEKMWDSFCANRLGRWYLARRNGVLKAALRPFLCWQLLRKAGLDHCAQLIVGSAPPGEALLRAYHELGIEIHNAYGLTEAPLVTLNRLGANRIGTTGTLLPQTELRVAEDGEILVRGPQVTPGYFNANVEPPFKDGWLCTGDIGEISAEGYLVILGRKKELIVTSYAKKIHPGKVESLLRSLPGIAEAMLVGDGKPYCAALLWVKPDSPAQYPPDVLERGIADVNTKLSHPEQVKRWTVLPYDLSIEGGELTANLKLKRQVVAHRFAQVIADLYDETDSGQAAHTATRRDERVAA